jgi:hypothetical protein
MLISFKEDGPIIYLHCSEAPWVGLEALYSALLILKRAAPFSAINA